MPKYKVSFYIEADDEYDAMEEFINSVDPEADFEFDVEEVTDDETEESEDE